MTDEDNLQFFEWLGGCDFAWDLYALVATDVTFDQPCDWKRRALFQGLCLDMQEDDLYLDVLGCLDAPL